MAVWQIMNGEAPSATLPLFDDEAPGGPGESGFDTAAVKAAVVAAGATGFNYVGLSPFAQGAPE